MSIEHPGMREAMRGMHAMSAHEGMRQSERRALPRTKATREARNEALRNLDVARDSAVHADKELQRTSERLQRDEENRLSVLGIMDDVEEQRFASPQHEFKYLVERYTDLGTTTATAGGATIDQQQRMRDMRKKIDKLLPKIAKQEVKSDLTIAHPELYRTSLEMRLHEIAQQESELEDTAPELLERDLIREKLALLDAKMREEQLIPPAEVNRREKLQQVTKSLAETRRLLAGKLHEHQQLSWYQWNKRRTLNQEITDLTHLRDEQEALARALKSAPRRSRVDIAQPLPDDAIEAVDDDFIDFPVAAK